MVMTEVAHIMKMRATLYPWTARQAAGTAADDLPVPFVEDTKPTGSRTASAGNPLWTTLAYSLSGAAGLVALTAAWMVLRARRRSS
jgi:hypothetical protein